MRLLLLVLAMFTAQGIVTGLLPENLAPPDLIFLLAILVSAVSSPYIGLSSAFALGLVQDLHSAGLPGFHATGLLFAALVFYRLSPLFNLHESPGQAAILSGAFLAKWLGYLLVAYWLRNPLLNPLLLGWVFVGELVFTLVMGPWVLRLGRAWVGALRG